MQTDDRSAPALPREESRWRRLHRIAPIALLAWVVANYGWTLTFGFKNDDFMWIYGSDLSAASQWLRAIVLPPMWAENFFRPLVQLSFVADYLVGGLHPLPYHLTNVLLHAACTLLVWQISFTVVRSAPVALVTALVFAVHPARAETVAWISGRTELVCGLFYAAAALLHLRGRAGWAVALFVLALCSKESAVSLPLVILTAEALGLAGSGRRWRRALPSFIVLALYLVLRPLVVQKYAVGVVGFNPFFPLRSDFLLPLLRWKVAALGNLLLDPLPFFGFLRSLLVLGGGFVAALLWTRWMPPPRRSAIRFALAWSVLTLLPYAGWILLKPYYLYIPTMGTSLLFVALGADLTGRMTSAAARKTLTAAGLCLWLAASVYRLQIGNAAERRAGVVTGRVVDSLVKEVPDPTPQTLLVVSGLQELQRQGVWHFGLPEAVRLRLHDRSLGVRIVATPEQARNAAERSAGRPVIALRWDDRTETFHRLAR